MDRIVLSLLVDNTSGVLSRVAGLFSRRGYNIESLTVGVTADERYSRMTVVSYGELKSLVIVLRAPTFKNLQTFVFNINLFILIGG